MKRRLHKNICPIVLFYFFALSAKAQVNPLFNDNDNFYSMSHRWELDSNNKRGTLQVTMTKIYFNCWVKYK